MKSLSLVELSNCNLKLQSDLFRLIGRLCHNKVFLNFLNFGIFKEIFVVTVSQKLAINF